MGTKRADNSSSFKWELISSLSDEFSSRGLDIRKWLPMNPQWKGRAPGWFSPRNVTVEDGALTLTCRAEQPPPGEPPEYKDFTTCFVRTTEQVCYGYFEISCIPADSITSSSFWFTGNTPELWNEIDVFELSQAPGHEYTFNTNVHIFRYPGLPLENEISDHKAVQLPSKTSSGPMRVAFDWTPETLRWIVNGRVIRTRKNDYFHTPMFLQFDCETMPEWLGLPNLDDPRLPARFRVHYVRSWKRVSLP